MQQTHLGIQPAFIYPPVRPLKFIQEHSNLRAKECHYWKIRSYSCSPLFSNILLPPKVVCEPIGPSGFLSLWPFRISGMSYTATPLKILTIGLEALSKQSVVHETLFLRLPQCLPFKARVRALLLSLTQSAKLSWTVTRNFTHRQKQNKTSHTEATLFLWLLLPCAHVQKFVSN